MMKPIAAAWFTAAALACALSLAQTPQLQFETASVKVHPQPPNAYLIKDYRHAPPFVLPTSNHFTDAAHVQDLVMEAYGVTEDRIRYLPAWSLSPYGIVFDIDATAAGSTPPTPAQLQQMLQSFLADRFHLKIHWETKQKVSLYALVVDKNGPKFHPFTPEMRKPGDTFAGTSLFAIARFLTRNLDNPVVDRTGLPAIYYDFDMDKLLDYEELDREQRTDQLAAQDYIRSTIPHELGLRLESRKENVDLLIVDHIDQPAEK